MGAMAWRPVHRESESFADPWHPSRVPNRHPREQNRIMASTTATVDIIGNIGQAHE